MDRLSFHLLIAALWLTAWANDIGVLVGSGIERHRRDARICRYVVDPSVKRVPIGDPRGARSSPFIAKLR